MTGIFKQRLEKLVLNLIYVGLIMLVILIMAEFLARVFVEDEVQKLDQVAIDSEAYSYYDWREQYALDREKPGAKIIYEPYSEWKRSDKSSDLINVRDGYRVSWEPPPTPGKQDFVIFMFGGSTTYGIESPDDSTIASKLARKLNHSAAKYRYLVKNYGASAFVLGQEMHLLIKLLRQRKIPDAVIFYDGLNEVVTRVGLGREHYYDVVYRGLLFRKTSFRARLRGLARKSRLLKLLTNPPRLMLKLFPLIDNPEQLRLNAATMLSGYQNNVRIGKALGRAYGFQSWFFWQPSMFNTAKTLTAEEQQYDPASSELHIKAQLAYDIVNEIIAEQKFFETTPVIDISHALNDVSETIFLDAAHITPIGNEAVAETMLHEISAELD